MFGMVRNKEARRESAPGKTKAGARQPALVEVKVSLAPELREKFDALGGEAWLREQLEEAELEPKAR